MQWTDRIPSRRLDSDGIDASVRQGLAQADAARVVETTEMGSAFMIVFSQKAEAARRAAPGHRAAWLRAAITATLLVSNGAVNAALTHAQILQTQIVPAAASSRTVIINDRLERVPGFLVTEGHGERARNGHIAIFDGTVTSTVINGPDHSPRLLFDVRATSSGEAIANLPGPQSFGNTQLLYFGHVIESGAAAPDFLPNTDLIPLLIHSNASAETPETNRAAGQATSQAFMAISSLSSVLRNEFNTDSNPGTVRPESAQFDQFDQRSARLNSQFLINLTANVRVQPQAAVPGTTFTGSVEIDGPTFAFDQTSFDTQRRLAGRDTFILADYFSLEFSPGIGAGTLPPSPEPQTWALLIAGIAALGWRFHTAGRWRPVFRSGPARSSR